MSELSHAGTTESPELLKLDEVAARLRVSPQTVKRWERDGRITAIRFSARTVRYSAAAVQRLISDQAQANVED